MTQEEKQILLQDLCARLPYGVKVKTPYNDAILIGIIDRKGYKKDERYIDAITDRQTYPIRYVQPYLRPMSSMTEDEKSELLIHILGNKEDTKYFQVMPDGSIDPTDESTQELINFSFHWINFDGINTSAYIDWLNARHFDYRGLIPKGLAIEAPKDMYKTE